jgi:shikimate kinase
MNSIIYLIGFMGCGKTTIGQQLATALGREFIDLDTYLEMSCNQSITEIFACIGEDGFRAMERATLVELHEKYKNMLIATGGGTPCFENNMEIMNRSGLTIYMQLSPSSLCGRLLHKQNHRPLIAGMTESEMHSYIKSKLNEREPFYLKAQVTVDASSAEIEDYIAIVNGCRCGIH